jgi:hypothetical protein
MCANWISKFELFLYCVECINDDIACLFPFVTAIFRTDTTVHMRNVGVEELQINKVHTHIAEVLRAAVMYCVALHYNVIEPTVS